MQSALRKTDVRTISTHKKAPIAKGSGAFVFLEASSVAARILFELEWSAAH